jgi:hypothetical protein
MTSCVIIAVIIPLPMAMNIVTSKNTQAFTPLTAAQIPHKTDKPNPVMTAKICSNIQIMPASESCRNESGAWALAAHEAYRRAASAVWRLHAGGISGGLVVVQLLAGRQGPVVWPAGTRCEQDFVVSRDLVYVEVQLVLFVRKG